jgi:hypothetical protein
MSSQGRLARLSEDELTLLEHYRCCGPVQRDMILDFSKAAQRHCRESPTPDNVVILADPLRKFR